MVSKAILVVCDVESLESAPNYLCENGSILLLLQDNERYEIPQGFQVIFCFNSFVHYVLLQKEDTGIHIIKKNENISSFLGWFKMILTGFTLVGSLIIFNLNENFKCLYEFAITAEEKLRFVIVLGVTWTHSEEVKGKLLGIFFIHLIIRFI